MKKLGILALLGWIGIVAAACDARSAVDEASPPASLTTASPGESAVPSASEPIRRVVSLNYSPWVPDTAVIARKNPDEKWNRLRAVNLELATVVLHSAPNGESAEFHAGIEVAGTAYELEGAVGYGDPQRVEIESVTLNGTELIKIGEFVGAAAPLVHYIRLDNGVPSSLLRLERHSTELDLDDDGRQELLLSVGTLPEYEIVRERDGQWESANVNEQLGGAVSFDGASKLFTVYSSNGEQVMYRVTAAGMETVEGIR